MNRRNFLTGIGVLTAVPLAGCLGDDEEDARESISVGSVEVELISTATAAEWYADGTATFLDARSEREWEFLRVDGAYLSPASDGLPENDPSESLDENERIITYCVCPHSLAAQRAASLVEDGFLAVYALDKGLNDWVDAGHPVSGDGATDTVTSEAIPEPDYH